MPATFDHLQKRLAAAHVRGQSLRIGTPVIEPLLLDASLDELSSSDCDAILEAAQAQDFSLYRYKPHVDLPRVKKVIGFLKGIQPENLLDVGSGRGVFLNTFLDAFPYTPVTSLDILPHRVQALADLSAGGIHQLTAHQADLCSWNMPDDSFDVVTLLEVLEHIPDVQQAIRAAVRLARRYVVVTVPSKPDDNPEHIHLLTKALLTEYFAQAGCTALQFDGVPGHLFMAARTGEP